MTNEPIDLDHLYRAALVGIHRAYIFMRFGAQGVHVSNFEDTELPGRNQLLIVPEPMPKEMLQDYLIQFRAWTAAYPKSQRRKERLPNTR